MHQPSGEKEFQGTGRRGSSRALWKHRRDHCIASRPTSRAAKECESSPVSKEESIADTYGPLSSCREKPLLSDREKEIVQLVAQGFRNKEIGEKLFISEQTVKNHLHNIFDKLGVSDRLELALYAIHHRLIDQSA